jgi:hypothetical protein
VGNEINTNYAAHIQTKASDPKLPGTNEDALPLNRATSNVFNLKLTDLSEQSDPVNEYQNNENNNVENHQLLHQFHQGLSAEASAQATPLKSRKCFSTPVLTESNISNTSAAAEIASMNDTFATKRHLADKNESNAALGNQLQSNHLI